MNDIPLWIAIAVVAFVLAMLLREDWWLLTSPSQRTQGLVIGHSKYEADGISYTALVEFTDLGGKTHVVEDGLGGQRPSPPEGATLEVVYPVSNPAKGRVRRPLLRAFLYAMLLTMVAPLLAQALGWIGG